jgi:ribosomal protein S18 acetylase RimI-like enzyme
MSQDPGTETGLSAVRDRYDEQIRRGATAERGGRLEWDGPVLRHVGAGPDDWNGVVWSALAPDGGDADAAIARQLAYFGGLGREFEWKLYDHDAPADLGARLAAAGLRPEPAETLMAAGAAGVAERLAAAAPPDGVRMVEVADAAGVELVAEVHDRVFGGGRERLRHRLLKHLAEEPGTLRCVVALAGETPVAEARLELVPGTDFAGLWGGATLPEWRGRGIYRALVAHRARIAAARGVRYLQVDASEDSRPILARLGFARLGTTTPYVSG